METYRGEFNRPDKNGEYTYKNLQGNIDCYTNVPDNATSNTPTIIHEHGAMVDWVWYDSQKLALDRNATCIFPASMTRDPINALETTYREVLGASGNTNNVVLTGHSAGGPATLKALATMYKEGYNPTNTPTVVMLDGSFLNCKLTSEEKEILAEKDVPIIAYYQLDNQKGEYENLGREGLNIALIRDYDCHGHNAPSTNFFKNEKGIFDFATGKGKLIPGNSGHKISVWSNGKEVYSNGTDRYNISAVETKSKLYSMWGINTYVSNTQPSKTTNTTKTASTTKTTNTTKTGLLSSLLFSFKRDKTYPIWNTDAYAGKMKQLKSLNKNLSFSINNSELDSNLNSVISNIKNTSYINSSVNASSGAGLQTITKISDLTTKYFAITTDLLMHISSEMQEFTKIGPAISAVEKQIDKNTDELGSAVLLSGITISTNQATEQTTSKEVVKEIPAVSKTDKPIQTNNSEEQKETPKEEKTKVETENNKPKEETKQPNNKDNSTTNKQTHNNKNNNTVQGTQNNKTNPLEQFPDYKEVYSDDTKIVYDYNNEYRIIVHKDGDEIVGIEHYYNFDNETEATNAINSLKLEYSNNENIKNIVQKGQYVKVIFKEEMYENLTIPEIRKQYSELNEIIKL